MSGSMLSYELNDGIAVLQMDDGKANALGHQLIDELNEALDKAASEARAVVLFGRPGTFCAGFDLKHMAKGPTEAIELVKKGGELLLRLYDFDKPVIMGCSGHALAGGVLLLATGDTRIGIRGEFKLGLNEVRNGMPVPILAHELARDRLDPKELIAAVVQAKFYDPESALEAGWVDELCDPSELQARCMKVAAELAALPGRAYGITKRSLRKQTIEHIRATLDGNVEDMVSSMGG